MEVNRVGHRHIDHHRYHLAASHRLSFAIATRPPPAGPDDGVDGGFRCSPPLPPQEQHASSPSPRDGHRVVVVVPL